MQYHYNRFGKPIVFSLLCFVCVFYLSENPVMALAVSSVPFLLGNLDIFPKFGYILTVFIFLFTIIVIVLPDYIKSSISSNVGNVIERTKPGFEGR